MHQLILIVLIGLVSSKDKLLRLSTQFELNFTFPSLEHVV